MFDEAPVETFPISTALDVPFVADLTVSLASFANPHCNSADLGRLSLAATRSCVFFASGIFFPSTISLSRRSAVFFGTTVGSGPLSSDSVGAGTDTGVITGVGAMVGVNGGGGAESGKGRQTSCEKKHWGMMHGSPSSKAGQGTGSVAFEKRQSGRNIEELESWRY